MVGASPNVVERGSREQEWTLLIRRVAEGDQAALGELYDDTSQLIYGLALRILSDATAAEEVSLEVYEQVWRQAANYDSQRGTLLGWLMMMTRSRAIDRLRSFGRQRQREESLDVVASVPSPAANPEEDTILSERRRLVLAALANLRPEQREAIELAYFRGMSQSEIASELQQPLGTIKTRIRLGMMKLRELLLPLEGEVRI
jgi:RNA polymerase sigma-70 factor (ECF subfamily)